MKTYYLITVRCDFTDESEEKVRQIRCLTLEEVGTVVAFIRTIMNGRTGKVCPDVVDEPTFDKIVDVVGLYAWIREITSVNLHTETPIYF